MSFLKYVESKPITDFQTECLVVFSERADQKRDKSMAVDHRR
jgi:hypothetical protein